MDYTITSYHMHFLVFGLGEQTNEEKDTPAIIMLFLIEAESSNMTLTLMRKIKR